jgi:quinone-modifying oxidoreductase subunit QmoB
VAQAAAGVSPYDSLIPPMVAGKIAEVDQLPNITVKTETEVARMAGQPGEFTVTLKKPGEKIEFDVPFPLPDEMKVDEKPARSWMPKNSTKLTWQYNEGRKTS